MITVSIDSNIQKQNFGLINETLVHDGIIRNFLYFIPSDLPSYPVPLIFSLHGGGGNATNTLYKTTEERWNELAEKDKFIVVYPNGVDHHWNDCRADNSNQSTADDVGFIEKIITTLSYHYSINPQRIYSTGHSNGGMMSFRVAMNLSHKFAAVFSCTGAMAAVSECIIPQHPIAIMYLAGTEDPLVPYEGGYVANNEQRGSVLSANETISYWKDFLETDQQPSSIEHLPDKIKSDDSTVTIYSYSNGSEQSEIKYYEVIGGGHGWPSPTQHSPLWQLIVGKKNQDMVACDHAWDFFKNHTLSILRSNLSVQDKIHLHDVKPGIWLKTTINLSNEGEPYSELDWMVNDTPDWGRWNFKPSSGCNLMPEQGTHSLEVSVETPKKSNQTFQGIIELINLNDKTDKEFINVTMTTKNVYSDLHCTGTIQGNQVKPGSVFKSNFTIINQGDDYSTLPWTIIDYPTWGNWTFLPSNETLKKDQKSMNVLVNIIMPPENNQTFLGQIKVVNKNNSSDYAFVHVNLTTSDFSDNEDPEIEIIRPTNAIYFRNKTIISFIKPIIIGSFYIQVQASDHLSEIACIQLYINDEIVFEQTNDCCGFYWDELFFGSVELKIVTYDLFGNSNATMINVLRIF